MSIGTTRLVLSKSDRFGPFRSVSATRYGPVRGSGLLESRARDCRSYDFELLERTPPVAPLDRRVSTGVCKSVGGFTRLHQPSTTSLAVLESTPVVAFTATSAGAFTAASVLTRAYTSIETFEFACAL